MITVRSTFTGIGGLDIAAEEAGMTILDQCEIDPHCRVVLSRHWPDVPCYTDIKELDGTNLPYADLLCAGFPCQDISIAGRRVGLAGERSGLFFEFLRVAAETKPRWIVLENVPGLLSSNDGRDFGTIIGSLVELGYGVAWRVLDAQYFGVAQRRRRVFIVGCLGNRLGGRQVLFEPQSGGGDTRPRREKGENVATLTANGVGTCGADDNQGQAGHLIPVYDPAPTLTRRYGKGVESDADDAMVLDFHMIQDPINSEEMSPALGARTSGMGVAYPLALRGRSDGVELEVGEEGLYNALRAGDGSSSRQPLVAYNPYRTLNKDGTITSGYGERPVVDALHGPTGNKEPLVLDVLAVRRLIPLECERLQGFPDQWTNITFAAPTKKNEHAVKAMSDLARYRMLGNRVAVPVVAWIMKRLAEVDARIAPAVYTSPFTRLPTAEVVGPPEEILRKGLTG